MLMINTVDDEDDDAGVCEGDDDVSDDSVDDDIY